MNKIKIAQVITRMDWGGSPDIVRILCSRLDRDRYEVTLITGPSRYPSVKTLRFFEESGVRVIEIPSLRRDVAPFADLAALYALRGIFKKEGFDIVHTHTAKAGFLGRLAAKLSGIRRVIHTPHGHNFYGYFPYALSWFFIRLEKYAAAWTERFIVFTRLEKQDMEDYGITDSEKITVVAQGVEFAPDELNDKEKHCLRSSLNIDSSQRMVTMVGRLEAIKGPAYFLEAIKEIAPRVPSARFVFVGEGSLRRRLEDSALQMGLSGQCLFTGWRDDAGRIAAVSDMVVQPSLNEAVGMSLIEAQSQGVCVVASRVGGIPEIVKDGETGILVDAKDTSGLASAILSLLNDDKRRLIMGEAARARIKDRFDIREMVKGFEKVYNA